MTATHEADFGVFIGRMRPVTRAHEHIIREALNRVGCLIVLVGSANRPRSYANSAFSYNEVCEMLQLLFKHELASKRMIIKPLPDYIYDEEGWVANTKAVVNATIVELQRTEINPNPDPAKASIALAGFGKDSTSFYLKRFPEWASIQVGKQYALLSACHIREAYFQRVPQTSSFGLSDGIIHYLQEFMHTDDFVYVVREREAIDENIKQFGLGPFNAGDTVLTHGDKVLTVVRGGLVGHGLTAFPGGMFNRGETLNGCALRELDEEGGIFALNPGFKEYMLSHFAGYRYFDAPHRDPRGHYISHAFHYALPDDFNASELTIEARDDAKEIGWTNIPEWGHETAFLDHYAILRKFLPNIHA